jgi:carboxymethylenebutenolidase
VSVLQCSRSPSGSQSTIHGGRFATDAPESPHLLAPKIKSRVYIAGAIEDQSFPDETK